MDRRTVLAMVLNLDPVATILCGGIQLVLELA